MQELCLFESGTHFNYGWGTESNIERMKWKYVHLSRFQEFPYIKTLELTSRSRSYFLSDMVLISLYQAQRWGVNL